jgi:predicted pyridoxine 5'-phosphate oxidase superfamily flavin-nucleotide-binding protein
MAKIYDHLNHELIEFIKTQKIFFTGTAASSGRVNVSPKGTNSLRVLNEHQILWLNLTGSGNETAAHLKEINRITLMFCAFEGDPLILRVYGRAETIHRQDEKWEAYYQHFPTNNGARNIFHLHIESVQTSCGFAVPLMDYQEDRTILTDWSAKKADDQMRSYWAEKNVTSIDGFPTGLFDEP